jgi:hypothetical protein
VFYAPSGAAGRGLDRVILRKNLSIEYRLRFYLVAILPAFGACLSSCLAIVDLLGTERAGKLTVVAAALAGGGAARARSRATALGGTAEVGGASIWGIGAARHTAGAACAWARAAELLSRCLEGFALAGLGAVLAVRADLAGAAYPAEALEAIHAVRARLAGALLSAGNASAVGADAGAALRAVGATALSGAGAQTAGICRRAHGLGATVGVGRAVVLGRGIASAANHVAAAAGARPLIVPITDARAIGAALTLIPAAIFGGGAVLEDAVAQAAVGWVLAGSPKVPEAIGTLAAGPRVA